MHSQIDTYMSLDESDTVRETQKLAEQLGIWVSLFPGAIICLLPASVKFPQTHATIIAEFEGHEQFTQMWKSLFQLLADVKVNKEIRLADSLQEILMRGENRQ